jgi:hypothetical protein
LLDRSRTWREFTLQIIEGILPVRLLFEAKKYWVDNGGIGSDPCNLLERKSKYSIFFQGRTVNGCSKLLKRLKDRFNVVNVSFPTFQNHLGTLPSILLLERSRFVIHFGLSRKLEIHVNCKKTNLDFKFWEGGIDLSF